MYKPLTVDHPSVVGNKNKEKNVRETFAAHQIWNEIGKFHQFMSLPFQWLILSSAMASSYFSFGSSYIPYLSIFVLLCVFIFGLFSKGKIENALKGKEEGGSNG